MLALPQCVLDSARPLAESLGDFACFRGRHPIASVGETGREFAEVLPQLGLFDDRHAFYCVRQRRRPTSGQGIRLHRTLPIRFAMPVQAAIVLP